MTNPIRIEETNVSDGKGGKKLVRPGEQVAIMPTDLRVQLGLEEIDFIAQRHVDFLEGWLGKGPHTISWIGRWPCGRDMLYLASDVGEPGAHASDFMIAE